MTQEQKAKAYDEAKARMSIAYNSNRCTIGFMNEIFPELAESEDEKVRKALIELVKYAKGNCLEFLHKPFNIVPMDLMLAWLEKQGEQKVLVNDFKAKDWYVSKVDGKIRNIYHSVDKVEPKFKVGDFIVNDYCMGRVVELTDDAYLLDSGQGIPFSCEHNAHLWTIQDAKDGDVLYECNEKEPFIFKELETKHIGDIASYCDIFNGIFNSNEDDWTTLDIVPAAKEQRDLLYQKMKEAGYEWDDEKKELKKVEQKSTDKVEQKLDIEKGKWYVCNTPRYTDFAVGKAYYCPKNGMLKPNENEMARYVARDCFHLWTIKDAKDGDVLAVTMNSERVWIGMFKEHNGSTFSSHCFISTKGAFKSGTYNHGTGRAIQPATKEQRDLLYQKMKEAGYVWDAEKKELKKIEQSPVDARTTGYWHVEDVEQKHTWSEEDEERLQSCLNVLQARGIMEVTETVNTKWLKSLKERIQPKQEWSGEDENHVNSLLKRLEGLCCNEFATTRFAINEDEDWLKSLKFR